MFRFQLIEERIQMFNQQNNKRSLGAILALGALVLSSSAFAASVPDTTMGMIVVRDAETGKLRGATPAEAQAMQVQENQLKASGKTASVGMLTGTASPQQVVNRHGAVMMELTEDTMVYSVVKRTADGKLDMQCVTGADAAKKYLSNKTIPATSSEHKHDK